LNTLIGGWSKDGKWLLATIDIDTDDNGQGYTIYQPVLIQVDTCQVIPLLNLNGEVKTWVSK
jgi:hypothetical protein